MFFKKKEFVIFDSRHGFYYFEDDLPDDRMHSGFTFNARLALKFSNITEAEDQAKRLKKSFRLNALAVIDLNAINSVKIV